LRNRVTTSTTAATTATQDNPEHRSTAKCHGLNAPMTGAYCHRSTRIGEQMPTRRPSPTFQIRVIGPTEHAKALLNRLAEQAMPLFGPLVTCRTNVRPARRRGHVRAYFTITPKEAEL
jgi:hypothetical protein